MAASEKPLTPQRKMQQQTKQPPTRDQTRHPNPNKQRRHGRPLWDGDRRNGVQDNRRRETEKLAAFVLVAMVFCCFTLGCVSLFVFVVLSVFGSTERSGAVVSVLGS